MPETNPNQFDPTFLMRGLTTFFGMINREDRQVLSTIFEQLFRSLDDEYHELNQINSAKSFVELQPYLQRDWLLRDLTKAEYIGTPHGHFDKEFTAVGGETTFAVGRPLDPGLATMLFINGVETPQGSVWAFDLSDELNPVITLANPAFAGDVFRLYAADVDAIAVYTANGSTTVFAFPEQIDVKRARIFHNNVELTNDGIEIRAREVLFKGGLSSGDVIQFRKGSQLHNVVAAAGQVRATCPFDIDASTIIRLGGINIRDGWVIHDTDISFKTAPRNGVQIKIRAPKITPHDHEVHQEVSTLGQTVITVPTPLGLDTGLVYNEDRPILVTMNGIVLDRALYTFTGVDEITLVVALLAGEQIQVHYHSADAFSHAHPDHEEVLVEALEPGVGLDLTFLEGDKPAFVVVNGVILREGIGTDAFQIDGSVIRFGQTLPSGSRIYVRGEKFQWTYRVDPPEWSESIVWVSSIQNGVDQPTIVLEPNVDYIIYEGALYLTQVFSNGWLKDVRLDLQTPYNNFGYLIDFRMPNSQAYVDLLKALWAAYVGGPRHYVLENFGRIMLGAPAAQFPGVVQAISPAPESEYVDILGDDGVLRRFTVSGMPVSVVVGDRVDRFTALGGGMRVLDDVVEPDWYLQFAQFLYAIEQFGTTFETGALLDKGIRSKYRVSAITDYDSVTHSIVITPTAFDFKLFEDLNQQVCRATIFQGSSRFDSRLVPTELNINNVAAVENLGWGYRINFDPAYIFAAPPAPATPTTVEFEFELSRRHDLSFIFDEYIKEHLDPVATQIYSILKANVFAIEIPEDVQVDQERMQLLFTLVERVKSLETNYIVLGRLPGIEEDLTLDITEDDPAANTTNFVQIPAYLVHNVSAYGIGWYGP